VTRTAQPEDEKNAPNGWSRAELRGFRAGDPSALGRVYERHARDVAQLLRHGFDFSSGASRHRFVGFQSTFDLQDALHETFRLAFEPRAREGYDGVRPYGPYVRTIARNVVLARFRRERRIFVPLDDAGAEADGASRSPTLIDDAAAPDEIVHEQQVVDLIQGFLATCDPEDRELVTLRFEEGCSQRDAAQRLGWGRQRVRTREVKLRRALVAYLRARGAEGLVPGGAAGVLSLGLGLGGPALLGELLASWPMTGGWR